MMLKLLSLWLIISLLVAAPLNPNLEKNGKEDDFMTDNLEGVGQVNDDTSLNSTRDPRLTIKGGNINFSGEISSSGNNAKINIGSISSDFASQEESNVQGVWTAWTKCSQTCDGGVRKRTCMNPAPGNDGKECTGDDFQSCNDDFKCTPSGVVDGVPVPVAVGVTGGSNADATSSLEASMRLLKDRLNKLPERKFNSEEKLLLKEIREAKMYVEENCANENGNCDSPTIESYAEEWFLILQKMIKDGELTSGYMDAFEKDFETLEAAVRAAQNVNKQTQQSVTVCNTNNEVSCTCGDNSCIDGQICTAGKCLDVCEIKDKEPEPLTADCFCIHEEKGTLCPEGDGNVCSKQGCLINVEGFFWFLFG